VRKPLALGLGGLISVAEATAEILVVPSPSG
jgi:hypothetical protein